MQKKDALRFNLPPSREPGRGNSVRPSVFTRVCNNLRIPRTALRLPLQICTGSHTIEPQYAQYGAKALSGGPQRC